MEAGSLDWAYIYKEFAVFRRIPVPQIYSIILCTTEQPVFLKNYVLPKFTFLCKYNIYPAIEFF